MNPRGRALRVWGWIGVSALTVVSALVTYVLLVAVGG